MWSSDLGSRHTVRKYISSPAPTPAGKTPKLARDRRSIGPSVHATRNSLLPSRDSDPRLRLLRATYAATPPHKTRIYSACMRTATNASGGGRRRRGEKGSGGGRDSRMIRLTSDSCSSSAFIILESLSSSGSAATAAAAPITASILQLGVDFPALGSP